MPSVVNLGTYGPQRKSIMDGAGDAFVEGMKAGMQNKTARMQIAADAETKKSALTLELAKIKSAEVDNDRKYIKDTIEMFALHNDGLDQTKQKEFQESEAYKSLYKKTKEVAPEWVDSEKQKIILPTVKGMAQDRMDAQHAALNEKVLQVGEEGLTPNEAFLYKSFQQNGTDLAAQTVTDMMKTPLYNALLKSNTAKSNAMIGEMFTKEYTKRVQMADWVREQQQKNKQGNPYTKQLGGSTNSNDPLGLGL
jgi:hypothetical protein